MFKSVDNLNLPIPGHYFDEFFEFSSYVTDSLVREFLPMSFLNQGFDLT